MDDSKNKLRIVGIILILILFVFTKPFTIVSAGNVGILYRFGKIIGQVDEGFNFIAPWVFVTHANIRVQREVLTKVASFSRESQDVYVKVSLNYQASATGVQNLYRNVGADYYHVLIEPRVAQNFKDETVKYASVDIAPNRENIRQAVRKRLEAELSPYSIHVFQQSIENKQIATQKALEQKQLIEVSKAQAQQTIEKERGAGDAALARAEKESLANQKIAASLTPLLVQNRMIEKLSDKVQIMIVPQGQNFLMQLPVPGKQ